MQITQEQLRKEKTDQAILLLLPALKNLDTKEKLGRYVIDPRDPNVKYPSSAYPMFDTAPRHPRFNEPYIAFYDFHFPEVEISIEALVHYLREGWNETRFDGKIFEALKKEGYEITILEQPKGKMPTGHYVGTIKLKQGLLPF